MSGAPSAALLVATNVHSVGAHPCTQWGMKERSKANPATMFPTFLILVFSLSKVVLPKWVQSLSGRETLASYLVCRTTTSTLTIASDSQLCPQRLIATTTTTSTSRAASTSSSFSTWLGIWDPRPSFVILEHFVISSCKKHDAWLLMPTRKFWVFHSFLLWSAASWARATRSWHCLPTICFPSSPCRASLISNDVQTLTSFHCMICSGCVQHIRRRGSRPGWEHAPLL